MVKPLESQAQFSLDCTADTDMFETLVPFNKTGSADQLKWGFNFPAQGDDNCWQLPL